MKLSKRGRYALRALVYLSLNSDKEKMTLSKIAKENDISTKYLEQIFSNLKRSGIVKSVAGINGGYLLARPSTDISVDLLRMACSNLRRYPRSPSRSLRGVRPSEKNTMRSNSYVVRVSARVLASDMLTILRRSLPSTVPSRSAITTWSRGKEC